MSTEIARVEFSGEQVALIKRTICQGSTDDELTLFLAQCKRTGLDPFARQIHAVRRFDKKLGREVMSIQIGIDGFRLIGDRTGLYDGQEGPFWCGADGLWRDVWISGDYPSAAKVLVYRKGCTRAFVGIAHWDEYAQTYKDGNPMPMWAQMPAGQLAKCAESLALRKAFPQELSGLYSPEEMGQTTEVAEVKPAPKPNRSEEHGRAIDAAATIEDLKTVMAGANADAKAGRLTPFQIDQLTKRKDARKLALAEPVETKGAPAPEGEKSSDPTSAAKNTSATTAPESPTSTATPVADAKPMPAAERRTAAPAPRSGDVDAPMAGANIVEALVRSMVELGVTWTEIRDGVEGKGREIAEAVGLAKMPAGARANQLTAAEALRLKGELETRLAEKRAKAAKRAANKGEREKELAAEEAGSAS